MKAINIILLSIWLAFILVSCYYDNPPGEIPIAIENVSFNRDIVPIFSNSCMGEGCHAGDHFPDLRPSKAWESLQGVNSSGELLVNLTIPNESPIYIEVKSGSMPPTGSLSRIEIEFIKAWIEKGGFND